MTIWLITSIRVIPGVSFPASAIQNIRTAMALAKRGHRVVLWVAKREAGWREWVEAQFNCAIPGDLHFFPCKTAGPKDEKKTPFDSQALRVWNISRANWVAGRPQLIVSRSPRALEQLRGSGLISRASRLVLEYQYPEWAQLWRAWRARHPQASLAECRERLRGWQTQEKTRLLAACDGVLYAAAGHEKLLRRYGYCGKAAILPSACETPESDPPRMEDQRYDFGFVGSLRPENGVHTLLRAMAALPGKSLLIVGEGPEGYCAELKKIAADLGAGQTVEFAGNVAPGQVRAKMRLCRVGVVPISARCGPEKREYASPLKLVEWLAAGVPVVAAGVPSILRFNEDNGIFSPPAPPQAWGMHSVFKPDSAEDLARVLVHLIDDAAAREQLAHEGLELAKGLSFAKRAERVVNFFGELSDGSDG